MTSILASPPRQFDALAIAGDACLDLLGPTRLAMADIAPGPDGVALGTLRLHVGTVQSRLILNS